MNRSVTIPTGFGRNVRQGGFESNYSDNLEPHAMSAVSAEQVLSNENSTHDANYTAGPRLIAEFQGLSRTGEH